MILTRHHPLKTLILASAITGLLLTCAHAKDTAAQTAARKAIAAQYKLLDQALEAKDLKTMLAVCTPDFESVTKEGERVSRAQHEAHEKELFADPDLHFDSCHTTVDKIEWFGTDAIVWNTSTAHITQGKISVDVTSSSRDLWHPIKGVWLTKRAVEIKTETKVNGEDNPKQ